MIPNEDMIEMMRLDFKTLEDLLKRHIAMMADLRDRHFKALKKVLLMELLLTMDLPCGRIPLTRSNVAWLLRNVQINNRNHPDLERVIRLLKEFNQDSQEKD